MSESRMQYLFQQWFNKVETPEEHAELLALLKDKQLDPALDQALEETWKGFAPDEEMEAQEAAAIFENITRPEKSKKIRYMLRLSAAAVAAAVIGICLFMFRQPEQGPAVANLPEQEEIAPGVQKATLTLADGSVITLDSVGNQVLTQGSSKVRQQGGQLLYDAEDNKTPVWNKLTTPRAGQFRIILPDGSRVWLNAASSIRYPTAFTGKERNVEVTGEVYFEVAHNVALPFRVNINNRSTVEVLGTSFNVNAYEDESSIRTTLLEGKVKISGIILKPGEQARLTGSGSIQVSDDIDPAEVIAWKEGWFHFNQAALDDVMRQLSRWYDVEISFKGALPQRTFEGKIQRDLSLNQVLNILQKSGVHSRLEGKKLILLP